MLQVDAQDRAKLIDPLFRAGWRFWLLVGVLSLLVGWGVIMYIRQLIYGLAITGMNRPVYWGLYMVNFVFFIGISLAGTFTSAILRLTGVEWRRPITRLAEAVTVFALIVATIQVTIDMGQPARLGYIVLYGRFQSPIMWDFIIVIAYLLSSATYLFLPLLPDIAVIRDNMPEDANRAQRLFYRVLALGWRGNVEQWKRLEKVVGLMAIAVIPIAVSVHTITSWLLATTVQPGWHSTVFGPYFVVTAIFSGISAIFVVMTMLRQSMSLQDYFTLRQYRGLAWLFVIMAVTWGYFTYTETLTLIAGQQMFEFPVLASKLFGQDVVTFWLMLGLIGTAFVIVLTSLLTPEAFKRSAILRPRAAISSAIFALLLILFLTDSQYAEMGSSIGLLNLRAFLWAVVVLALLTSALGAATWFKLNPVSAAVIAGIGVLAGTWIERWNIIVPTLTHPRMIRYADYTPTITEIALTIGSVALFFLMFAVFFKLFPAVSIWEIEEGRVIEDVHEQMEIPVPEPSNIHLKKRRWIFR